MSSSASRGLSTSQSCQPTARIVPLLVARLAKFRFVLCDHKARVVLSPVSCTFTGVGGFLAIKKHTTASCVRSPMECKQPWSSLTIHALLRPNIRLLSSKHTPRRSGSLKMVPPSPLILPACLSLATALGPHCPLPSPCLRRKPRPHNFIFSSSPTQRLTPPS